MNTQKMNKKTDQRIFAEQLKSFHVMWNQLEKEQKELLNDYNIARNMACSEWTDDKTVHHMLVPTKILPDMTKLLWHNYQQLLEQLSFSRYCLIKTYLPLLKKAYKFKVRNGKTEKELCYEYWEEKLGK